MSTSTLLLVHLFFKKENISKPLSEIIKPMYYRNDADRTVRADTA